MHNTDTDCTIGTDDCCDECGVFHGDPCDDCGGRGFHNDGCSEIGAATAKLIDTIEALGSN